MRTTELEGKLVLFKFSPEIRVDLPLFQIYKDEVWAIVSGVEQEGVWIENHEYELGIWWDDKGQLVPEQKQIKEKMKTHILIPWRYIKTLMSVEDERFQKIQDKKLPGFHAYR